MAALSVSSEPSDGPRHAAAILALGAGAVLGIALAAQYGLGLRPCALCHWQRVPWILAFGLGVLGFVLPAARRPIVVALGIGAVVLAGGLGLYHLGVEQGAWPSFLSSCSGEGLPARITANDLLQGLSQPAPPRCDVAAPWWFGFSMAGWNAVAAALVALIAAWAARGPGLGIRLPLPRSPA